MKVISETRRVHLNGYLRLCVKTDRHDISERYINKVLVYLIILTFPQEYAELTNIGYHV
jgi:hypothetical protein